MKKEKNIKKRKAEKRKAVRELFDAFKKFISRGNVVDMAVGVTVATAFTAIVTAFTKGFISPLLALLTSDADLASLKWVLRPAETVIAADGTDTVVRAEVSLLWGTFLQSVIDFFIVAVVLFLIMRIFARLTKSAAKLAGDMHANLPGVKEEAAAEAAAAAKAEAEEKAAAEAAAAEAEAEKARAIAESEKTREQREEELQLLRDIKAALQSISANKD